MNPMYRVRAMALSQYAQVGRYDGHIVKDSVLRCVAFANFLCDENEADGVSRALFLDRSRVAINIAERVVAATRVKTASSIPKVVVKLVERLQLVADAEISTAAKRILRLKKVESAAANEQKDAASEWDSDEDSEEDELLDSDAVPEWTNAVDGATWC